MQLYFLSILLVFVVEVSANKPLVTCPGLEPANICTVSNKGLQYNDGCNGVTCDGAGTGTSTMMFCPAPSNDLEKEYCKEIKSKVAGSDNQKTITCPDLSFTKICTDSNKGFQYNDGCNGVTCDGAGTGISTMMFCPGPSSAAEKQYCAGLKAKVESGLNSGASSGSDKRYTCPQLSPELVCKANMEGFSYNDGCNSIICGSEGQVMETTLMMCEEGKNDNAKLFCEAMVKETNDKKSRSKKHRECLSAANVCVSDTADERFYDGCNYCFCSGKGRAGCTRRACPSFFGTEEEFKKECSRRGAGIMDK